MAEVFKRSSFYVGRGICNSMENAVFDCDISMQYLVCMKCSEAGSGIIMLSLDLSTKICKSL